MDDSHDQTKNQTDGAQQGIFSTPELTVDTEKIAEGAEAAAEASRAKIASIFANTETGQQAQRLNDAMIANSEPATEDIVINNGPKKKSKLPIVLAILVLIAAVGGVVAWMVMNVGVDSSEVSDTVLADSFYKYTNYLLSGEESVDEPVNILQRIDNSKLNSLVSLNTEQAEKSSFFEKARGLLTTSYDVIKDGKSEETATLRDMLEVSEGQLSIVERYSSLSDLGLPMMMSYRLRNGSGALVPYVNTYYEIFSKSAYDDLTSLAVKKNAMAEGVEELFDIYADNGCITSGELSDECMNQVVQGNAHASQLQDVLISLSEETSMIGEQLVSNVFSGCQGIIRVLNGSMTIVEEEE